MHLPSSNPSKAYKPVIGLVESASLGYDIEKTESLLNDFIADRLLGDM